MKKKHPILVIGVGLKGPESLRAEMLERVRGADILVGGEKVLRGFKAFPASRLPLRGPLDGLDMTLRRGMDRGLCVVVLSSGDPNFFGVVRYLLASFRGDELEIHPHVSSVQLAFARVRLPWDDAVFVSVHGRELDAAVHALRRHPKVAVLTDPKNHPARVARVLLKAGIPDCRAFVLSRLGGPEEQVLEGTLESLAGRRFPDLNVMIVLNPAAGSEGLGIPDYEFSHDRGMITGSEIRAVTLSKLRMRSGHLLWDIGAGSGSVSVEATDLADGITAYAVEKSRRRMWQLKTNIRRLAGGMIHPVSGEAPSALKALPDPDRIFIGGSGGNLRGILSTAVRRLRPQGRIVVNAVCLETLHEARDFLEKRRIACEVVSLQVAKGRDLKGRVMLKAENPVFIITAEKE